MWMPGEWPAAFAAVGQFAAARRKVDAMNRCRRGTGVFGWLAAAALTLSARAAVAQSEPDEIGQDAVPENAPEQRPAPATEEGEPAVGVPEPASRPERPSAAEDQSGTITVIGTRLAETAGSAHVISERKLERFGYDDPTAVLLSVPGVYARGEDGMGMRNNIGLRGVNPDRSKKITLLEDGILFAPAPYSAPAAYYFPLMMRMTGLEVLKGPAAVAYGPYTIAGAINLITRPIPTSTSAGADVAIGQYGYGKIHAHAGSTTDDRMGFLIEGVHMRNTGFKQLASGGETGAIHNEWMGKLSYVIDPDAAILNEISLKATYSDEDAHETYTGLTDADFRADPLLRYSASQLDHMVSDRTSFVLKHELTFSPEVSLITTLYDHHYYRSWRRAKFFGGTPLYPVLTQPDDPQYQKYAEILRGQRSSMAPDEYLYIGPNEREFFSRGIDSRLRAQLSTGPLAHRFEAGVSLHYDSVRRRHWSDAYIVNVDNTLIPAGLASITENFEEVNATAFRGYIADGVTWGPATLTPGVRFEYVQFQVENYLIPGSLGQATTSTHAVLPGVGAYVRLFEGFGVLAGVTRGFSPPVPETQPAMAGAPLSDQPLPESETSVNYEAGARYMLGATRAEAIGFYNDYNNLTDVCTQSSGCDVVNADRQFSAGAATIYGVEVYVEHTFALGPVRVPVGLAYTYTQGTFDESFNSDDPIFGNVEAGDHMPYLPEHQGRASIAVESPSLGGEIGVTYVAPMREEAGKEPVEMVAVRTDEQLVVDIGIDYHITDWWSAYGNLRNVFNEQAITGHRPQGARPNAPRWLQFGVKLRY
jgi:Fe(3+) dicitrate transport protein